MNFRFLSAFLILSIHISARNESQLCQGYSIRHVDTVPLLVTDFNYLYKRIPNVENIEDSIGHYKKKINTVVAKTIKDLQSDTLHRWDEKEPEIKNLKIFQKSYLRTIETTSEILYLSYGKIPRERGRISRRYYFLRLKEEYLYISQIVDNINANLFLSNE